MTALIIESYRRLQPDSGDNTVVLLAQISQQLSAISNSSQLRIPEMQLLTANEHFTPSASIVVCNFLWFLSLGFSLACALACTLVEQWVRHYLQDTQQASVKTRARIRSYLYYGVEKFGMDAIVETVPLLLHISLFLFFTGLAIFLFPINRIIGSLCIAILMASALVYLIPTVTPVIYRQCPYRTPLTPLCWRLFRALPLYTSNLTITKMGNLRNARLHEATAHSVQRYKRDHLALSWLIESFTDEAEFEVFLEPFTILCGDLKFANDPNRVLITDLMCDSKLRLGRRIMNLLNTSQNPSLPLHDRKRRASTCYYALWALIRTSFFSRHMCFVDLNRTWFFLNDFLELIWWADLSEIHLSFTTLVLSKLFWELGTLPSSVRRTYPGHEYGKPNPTALRIGRERLALLNHYFSNEHFGFQVSQRKSLHWEETLKDTKDFNSLDDIQTAKHLAHMSVGMQQLCFVLLAEYVFVQASPSAVAQGKSGIDKSNLTSTIAALWIPLKDMLSFSTQAALMEEVLHAHKLDVDNAQRTLGHLAEHPSDTTDEIWHSSYDQCISSLAKSLRHPLERDAGNIYESTPERLQPGSLQDEFELEP